MRSAGFRYWVRGSLLSWAVAAAIWLGSGSVMAAATVHVWPAPGNNVFGGLWPSAQTGCSGNYYWQHGIATNIFDGGSTSGLYVYYWDVYGGSTWSPSTQLYWFQVVIIDSTNSSNTRTYTVPYAIAYANDWTIWVNRWFGYQIGTHEVVVTSKSVPQFGAQCGPVSTLVFRH